MTLLRGFAPLVGETPHTLILGSMPGAASLAAAQYYAHPRNAFWSIVAGLTGVQAAAPYDERVAGLTASGFALWDVLGACERPTSLDSDIVAGSMMPNPVAALLAEHPGIALVACNGSAAFSLYRRFVAPTLPADREAPRVLRLPSTSPAHAARSVADKRAAWVEALRSR